MGKLIGFLIILLSISFTNSQNAFAMGCTYMDEKGRPQVTQATDEANCSSIQKFFADQASGGTKTGTPKSAKVGDSTPSPVSMDQEAPDMHKAIGSHAQVLFRASQSQDFDVQYNDLAGGKKNLVYECWNSRDNADYGCLEKYSTKIQSGAKLMGPILASVSMVSGTSMACSKWGEALKLMQGAMAAFNAECGFMKGRCDTRCVDANERMGNFSASVENICNKAMMTKLFNPQTKTAIADSSITETQFVTACTEVRGYVKAQMVNTRKGSVANNAATCKSYSEQYMAGVMGLIGTIQSNRMAQACDKDSSDQANCAANPTAPGCKQEKTCDDPSKANSPECICERNPRAPGCGASVSTAGTSDYGNSNYEGGSRNRGTVANLPPGAGGGGDPGTPPAGNGGAASAASAGGGSYGGGGMGGGSGAGKSAADKNAASVAGASRTGDGGFSDGGGGGRSMRFTPGNRDTTSKSPLNKYMPKPTDGMIGAYQPGSNPSVEITGPHGKNLFDKISDRYREIGPQMNP